MDNISNKRQNIKLQFELKKSDYIHDLYGEHISTVKIYSCLIENCPNCLISAEIGNQRYEGKVMSPEEAQEFCKTAAEKKKPCVSVK